MSNQARAKINFNRDWKFHLGDDPSFAESGYNDSGWNNLVLPHDWGLDYPVDRKAPTGGSGGYAVTGIGWYRKKFEAPALSADDRLM
jgi:beta-galactosidase